MENIDLQKYYNLAVDGVITFLPKLILAVLIIWVGIKIINLVLSKIQALLQKSSLDKEIEDFLGSMLSLILKAILVLVAASIVGIKFSALFGILAAAGFAVGLALQGFLGNFASGLTIVFFKPYKVGDWVQISEYFGKVTSIQIFNTTLVTPGEKTLIVPNGKVTDSIILNFSTRGHMRLELKITIPYGESYPRIKKILEDTLADIPMVLKNPAPTIGIESFDSHNIILAIRPMISPDNYWDVTYDVYARIKSAFQKHGVSVAYSEGIELGKIGE